MVAEFRDRKTKLVHKMNHREIRRARIFVVVGVAGAVVARRNQQHLRVNVAQTVDNESKLRHVLNFCVHVVDRENYDFLLKVRIVRLLDSA